MASSATRNPLPRQPIPDPILSDQPGTWAHDTMSRRVDGEILQRTADDNPVWETDAAFAQVRQRFLELRSELQTSAPLKPLDPLDDNANAERKKEHEEWTRILEPLVAANDTWLSAPWMITEFYVYRRLIQAIGYWDEGTIGYQYDPFAKQKRAGLLSSVASAEAVLGKVTSMVSAPNGVALAASIALWGNKMDLSLWPADATAGDTDVFTAILDSAAKNLLHDDSEALISHCQKLKEKGGGALDIIIDNAGFELITDLVLGQFLVQSGIAHTVTFQLKSHPTFVSDALEKDLLETVEHYQQLDANKYPAAQAAGSLWKSFLDSGKWKCHEDNFWVQPFAMWDMTEPLRSDMKARCELAFVKGDANYRRLLGDCKWDLSAPFEDVVGAYFPCPVTALRTLKAEIGCGMYPVQVQRAQSLDKNWMTNGRFGVVQFGRGADS